MKLKTILLLSFLGWKSLVVFGDNEIKSGEIWKDNTGVHINAHGGGVLFHNGKYYWFGEYKSEDTSAALRGVTCYASDDLVNWTNQGIALAVTDEQGSDIERGCTIERPKVVYNSKAQKFVMWFHLELKGRGYAAARAAVAISDRVEGPYTYLRSGRVNAGELPANMNRKERERMDKLQPEAYKEWWTPTWTQAVKDGLFVKRDLEGGQMARDMTVFVDDDKHAYHIYSSEDNLTLHIAELTDDYTAHTGKYVRLMPAGHNEAPAIFKKDGTYWMITSGCTGWDPNEARMFSAKSIWGPWMQHTNPYRGDNHRLTFGGQSTYILKVEGKPNAFIFMADIWRPKHPIDARYIWLPIDFEKDVPVITWREVWNSATYWK